MRVLLLAAIGAALAAGSASTRSDATATEPARAAKTLSPVLGISYRSPGGALAWFEPLTLRMLPGRKAPLGGHLGGSWAFSPDRSTLAVANCERASTRPGIRFVNARAMRVLGDIQLSRYDGCTDSLTWLKRDRLLAIVRTGGRSELVVVDPLARRIIRRDSPWGDWSIAIGRTADELVLLLASPGAIGPARLAVVDAEGTMRVATVDGVLAGTVEVEGGSSDYRARTISPGLAVDPGGRRAFIVPHEGAIVEIDLATLAVSYHELERPSLLGRFWRWFMPSADAKMLEGPVRQAGWLGDGMIGVSGQDYSIDPSDRGEERFSASPVGLSLIDTRSWTTRRLDDEASGFAVASGLVIAQGGRWDSGQERGSGPGLRAFGLDGQERWRLRSGEYRWMDTAGSVGYVYIGEWGAEVVDLTTGSILATVRWDVRDPRLQLPQLLSAQTSSW